MSGEVHAAMGMPMEAFFNSASAATQRAPAETSVPPPKPVPAKESAQVEMVGESIPKSAKIPTP